MTINKHINNGVEGYQIFDEKGNEYFLIEATEELAIEKYNKIKFRETNPPPPTYDKLRAKEYLAQGITIDVLTIALWEKVVEDRPEAANMLQTKRQIIKDKYPKP